MPRKKKVNEKANAEESDENNNNNDQDLQLSVIKKAKTETDTSSKAITTTSNKGEIQLAGPKRTSNLKSPILLMTGHKAEVLCVKFNPTGKTFATAGFDKNILLWNVYGESENFATLTGHTNAILQLNYSYDGSKIVSASADYSGAVYDLETQERLKRLKGHSSHVNSCFPERRGASLICTGSDDGAIRLWSLGTKNSLSSIQTRFPITSVCWSREMDQIISAGVDHVVRVWDIRKTEQPVLSLEGHHDIITGIDLSPDGTKLLTNSMDNTSKIFDVRSFVPNESARLIRSFEGHRHDFQKILLRCAWSPDGTKICVGSADKYVYIWDADMGKLLYKLPGHKGSVNDVCFHPEEPIVASASSDKTAYLGEYAK